MRDAMKVRSAVSRRGLLAGLGALALVGTQASVPQSAYAATDRVAKFMNRLKGPLLRAAKEHSPSRFLRVIRSHADVPNIALYSLGSYRDGLDRSRRRAYYTGVARYMANYFALMSKEYKVVDAEVVGNSWNEGDDYYIDTKITLESGSTYNVRWQLKKKDGKFKIADVRVLGFWLAWLQRQQFQSFIESRGGSVNSLVVALNP